MSKLIHPLANERHSVNPIPVPAKRQQGVVLVISLIMLLLMTIIGTTGMQATSLEEKMAGNMRDRNLAFQAAEAALKEGEAQVTALPYNCAAGRFLPMDSDCNVATMEAVPVWDSINWAANSILFVGMLANVNANPRYIIEDMGVVPVVNCTAPLVLGVCPERYYRVTARATGGTAEAVVIVQSILQR
jgi:type IV pilus assembly protein PilX